MAQLNLPALTITIPTYNRPKQLLYTLSRLLPQLNSNCNLCIIDNCSDTPVTETTAELFKSYPDVNYKIYRNKVNIGGDANIIRCFEYCDTDWLWTLGDDDDLTDNAIAIIFDDIIKHPDALFINYNSPSDNRPTRTNTVLSYGRKEFLKNIDSFGATIFISCNVQNTKYLKKSQWLANSNTYSCVTQWLIVFYSLSERELTILSEKVICINPVVTTGNESVSINVIQGVSTLLDLRISFIEKQLLIDCFKRDMKNFVSLESLFRIITMQYISSNDKNNLFIFKRLYYGFYKYFGFTLRFKFYIYYSFLSISPSFTFNLIRKKYLKKRGIDLWDFVKK